MRHLYRDIRQVLTKNTIWKSEALECVLNIAHIKTALARASDNIQAQFSKESKTNFFTQFWEPANLSKIVTPISSKYNLVYCFPRLKLYANRKRQASCCSMSEIVNVGWFINLLVLLKPWLWVLCIKWLCINQIELQTLHPATRHTCKLTVFLDIAVDFIF